MNYIRTEKGAIARCSKDGMELGKSCSNFKDNKTVVMAAVKQNGMALKFASDEMRDNKEIVLEAIKQDGRNIRYASDNLKADEDVAMAAIEDCHGALPNVSPKLKADKNFAMKATAKIGLWTVASIFFDKSILTDKDVIKNAIDHKAWIAVKDMDIDTDCPWVETIKNDKELMKDYFSNSKGLWKVPFEIKDEFIKDRDFVIKFIKACPDGYTIIPDEFKQDKAVVVEAIKGTKCHLSMLSKELQTDKDIITNGLAGDGIRFTEYKDVSDEIKADKDMFIEFVKNEVNHYGADIPNSRNEFFNAIPELIKNDKETMVKAVSIEPLMMCVVPESFKNDPEFADGITDNGNMEAFARLSPEMQNDRSRIKKLAERQIHAFQPYPSYDMTRENTKYFFDELTKDRAIDSAKENAVKHTNKDKDER